MKYAVSVSVIITLFLLSVLILHTLKLVDSVNAEMPKFDKTLVSVAGIEAATTATEGQMAGLADDMDTLVRTEQQASSQQVYDVHLLAVKVSGLIDNTEVSVGQLGKAAKAITDAVPPLAAHLQGTMDESQQTLRAATRDLSSPAISISLNNIEKTSGSMAETTGNMAATTKDVQEYVHRETAPVKGFWNITKGIIGWVWAIRGASGF